MSAYWEEFWRRQAARSTSQDPQAQVMRTWQGQPVSEDVFREILGDLEQHLAPDRQHDLLDLCGGNGLISMHLAPRYRSVVCVDVAPELLARVDTARHRNLKTVVSEALSCSFPDHSFDRIVLYAALQYFEYREAVTLLGRLFAWLRPGGKAYLGDVPDADRMWRFFDTPDREDAYFQGVAAGKPLIGTWFSYPWIAKLARHCGFAAATRIDQRPHWPYAHFRFDASLWRGFGVSRRC
jgi:cyclopropane fatty-acyl-phospholipid synthase-like methyltransferase